MIPLKGVKTMDSTGNLVNGGFENRFVQPELDR